MDRMKKCTKCSETKPLEMFYLSSKVRKDGSRARVAMCKSCDYAKTRKYEQDNYEYVAQRRKKYSPKDPEKRRERQREWRKANPETLKAYWAKARATRPESVARCIARWHKANPEKRREYSIKYYKANKQKVLDTAKLSVTNISRGYVASLWGVPAKDLPESAYEVHKIHIQIKRYLKNGN